MREVGTQSVSCPMSVPGDPKDMLLYLPQVINPRVRLDVTPCVLAGSSENR
jgi:hypothetical protein